MNPFISAVLLLVAGLGHISWAQDSVKPVIESIEGDGLVVVKSQAGSSKPGTRGTEINFGDKVKTGAGASAKIRYPDGSKLLVGRGTEVEVQENTGGSQYNKVYSGYVRGLIRKAGQPDKNSPPRFIIRSRTVVMGVRGTDFVLNQNAPKTPNELEIHTFDGVVEVAKDEKTLLAGKGVEVARDQMIDADAAKINPPRAFDRGLLEQALAQAQPDFNSFIRKDQEAFRSAQEEGAQAKPDLDQQQIRQQEHQQQQDQKENDEKAKREPPKPRWTGALFQAGPVYMSQRSGGELFSGEVSWSPQLQIWWIFSLRGTFGMFLGKSRTSDSTFPVLEATAHAVVALFWNTVLLEPGISWKRWDFGKEGENQTDPILQASLRFGDQGFIERVFAAYTTYDGFHNTGYLHQDVRTQIFKAGVGFRF